MTPGDFLEDQPMKWDAGSAVAPSGPEHAKAVEPGSLPQSVVQENSQAQIACSGSLALFET